MFNSKANDLRFIFQIVHFQTILLQLKNDGTFIFGESPPFFVVIWKRELFNFGRFYFFNYSYFLLHNEKFCSFLIQPIHTIDLKTNFFLIWWIKIFVKVEFLFFLNWGLHARTFVCCIRLMYCFNNKGDKRRFAM